MGIQVEFNPDLALRNIREFNEGRRGLEECIPKDLRPARVYKFLKQGQRNYWLEGVIPLLETKGNGNLSRPLAAIIILEATHYVGPSGTIWTKGLYEVQRVYGSDDTEIHFDGFNFIK
ncbi:MAG: hypothetical protein ABIJ18_04460 [archaeon]